MVPLSHPCSKDFHYHPAVGVPWSLRSRLWPRRMSKGGQVGHQHDDVPTATSVAPGLPHLSLQVETKAHSREAQPSVASDHSCNKVSQMKVMREREIISVFRIVFPLVCLNRNKHVRLSDMFMAQKKSGQVPRNAMRLQRTVAML
jgi:hypothetical protein